MMFNSVDTVREMLGRYQLSASEGDRIVKEIGGFLEWETYSGAEYHQEALALNSARNALRFLLRAGSSLNLVATPAV